LQRIIDVLKADVEGAEWPFLVDFVQSQAFKQVKQFIVEPHTPRRIRGPPMSLIDYAEAYDDFSTLEFNGFSRFLFHNRNNCCGGFATLVESDIAGQEIPLCCYEQFFVNTKL
jgi:hypothetical protein